MGEQLEANAGIATARLATARVLVTGWVQTGKSELLADVRDVLESLNALGVYLLALKSERAGHFRIARPGHI